MSDENYYRKWMNIYEERCDKLIRMGFWNKVLFTFLGKVPKEIYDAKQEEN